MKASRLHRWDVSLAEARTIQEGLRREVELRDRMGKVRTLAGADAAIDAARGRIIAGVILYEFPSMNELERTSAEAPLRFPYVPGLLSFREAPALLLAFSKLRYDADVILFDGQGIAHPRRFGLACHMGVMLDRATIGCAKSRLCGAHREPAAQAGSWTPLRDGDVIGAALRTRSGVKPVYVSPGHRISLARAIDLTLAVCDGTRIPKPTREADRYVEEMKRRLRNQGR